ncbi:MAG: FMN-binding protein [Gammaproteobacteria bacterium]|jgi:electron transport complex protein RnfG|nr:FMN-binding protein [Gammaproteobacteria bacterium]MBT4606211.1 FMN-binding protein [Thiotrichales bacterium]MBT7830291.1 FMN-binding protein [Candidatus Neomarinimicrobiota bacterium]MBT3473819.1 FMN-binding protein [Gammaproteobacteria bacterium]MBT3966251.1 FMN-binding protein [Gammaproteobacteria bacterium]
MSTPIQQKEPSSFRLASTLAVAGLISGVAIVSVYEATLPTITHNKAEELKAAVFKVLPEVTEMRKYQFENNSLRFRTEEGSDDQTLYGGYNQQGAFVGYAIPSAGPGFQDTIGILYGYIPEKRKVVGMEILESRETPGLGDKIYKDLYFVSNFSDLSIDPEIVVVKKGLRDKPHEVDAITGATISSKAVVRIINEGNQRWISKIPTHGIPLPEKTGE